MATNPVTEKTAKALDVAAAQHEAMKIMLDAKKLLEQTGLEGSLSMRCPDGARWPVLINEFHVGDEQNSVIVGSTKDGMTF